jgi:hypothetical protein
MKKWISALKSGKYRQTQCTLKRVDNAKHANYCCLGLLCNLSNKGKWVNEFTDKKIKKKTVYRVKREDGIFDYGIAALPRLVREEIGISLNECDILANMNDVGRKSFKDIANYLEKCYIK